jgi:hypothetical protein
VDAPGAFQVPAPDGAAIVRARPVQVQDVAAPAPNAAVPQVGGHTAVPPDAPNDSFPAPVAELVMEYLGVVPSGEARRRTRNEMLRSQLLPKYFLGGSESMVCSTGNGCLTMIGWIDSLLMDNRRERPPQVK